MDRARWIHVDKKMRSGESLESGCDRSLRKISLMRERFKSSTPTEC